MSPVHFDAGVWTYRYTFLFLNLKATMVDTLLPSGLISPNIPFTYTPFWEVLNRCLYSISPVHIMVGNKRFSHAPWPHFKHKTELSHKQLWSGTNWDTFRSIINKEKIHVTNRKPCPLLPEPKKIIKEKLPGFFSTVLQASVREWKLFDMFSLF